MGYAGTLSHVSLLARNLAIPHASIDASLVDTMRPWEGQRVVLAVSLTTGGRGAHCGAERLPAAGTLA
ncbi:MAG: hypothetical protein R3C68_17670 [Myxococcota bacterium]